LILLNAKFKLRAHTIINKKLCICAAGDKYGVCADKKTQEDCRHGRRMVTPAANNNAATIFIS